MQMPIITLTSDWGLKDHYLAAVKGTIFSLLPEAHIVDISHEVPQFDLAQAAFIIRNSYPFFPNGSIHIVGINTVASIETPHVAIEYKNHFFIGADNGIFSLIFDNLPEKIIEIEIPQDSDYFTFSTKDVFVKAACMIAKGSRIEELGSPITTLNDKLRLKPILDDNSIKGMVIYVDVYENVITNISENQFRKVQKGRDFVIEVRKNTIKRISKSYTDVREGDILAMFGSNGLMQIALSSDKAKSLLGLDYFDIITITFK
jgi:S-adenosylmethionine hydrolase